MDACIHSVPFCVPCVEKARRDAALAAARRVRDAIVSYVMDNLPTHALSNEAGRMFEVRQRMDIVKNAPDSFLMRTIGDAPAEEKDE